MQTARLEMALRAGIFAKGLAGHICVFGPQSGDDLTALHRSNVTVVTGFKPDFDHFAALGFAPVANPEIAPLCDLALVCLPRSKAAAHDLLARAAQRLKPGGALVLDGQKTDGIGAVLRDLADLGADISDPISKSHGKLALFSPPAGLAGWLAAPQTVSGGFITCAGVFSADGPDAASQLLASVLPPRLPAKLADFGAGWGFLAREILAREGVKSLDLIEADRAALDCAQHNITDPRAQFHWSDATIHRPPLPYDGVIMNPPFHAGRTPDAGLGIAFIRNAHARLASHGQLWLVANRQLPYAPLVQTLFREVEELGNDPRFRLIRAAFPQRGR